MTKPFRFRHVNEITGTFVLVVIAVLIAAILWTGRSQRWYKSNVRLRIILPEDGASGIRQGSEVFFLGTLVGSVSDVLVKETGRMEAQARIRRDFFRFVRVDSSAAVKKKFGVAGDSFFEITRGQGPPLSERNASIVCNEHFQSVLDTAIEDIRHEALLALKKARVGLDTWTQLGTDLIQTRKRLHQLTIRLERMTSGIESGKGTVGQLMTNQTLADESHKLLAGANEVMGELRSVAVNLKIAAKSVQTSAARLPEIADTVANEAADLPGLVMQTQASMRELEQLMAAMQRHWLLRKYVAKDKPDTLVVWPSLQERKSMPAKVDRSPKDLSK